MPLVHTHLIALIGCLAAVQVQADPSLLELEGLGKTAIGRQQEQVVYTDELLFKSWYKHGLKPLPVNDNLQYGWVVPGWFVTAYSLTSALKPLPASGLSIRLPFGFSVGGHVHQRPEDGKLDQLEINSTYHLTPELAFRASYDVAADATPQQLSLGIGYRF